MKDAKGSSAGDQSGYPGERDKMTGVYGSAHFERVLSHEVSRTCRYGCPLSLALLKIGDFKSYADEHGQNLGDALLQIMGRVLLEATRDVDVAARCGPEEFAVVAPETPKERAVLMARRIVWAFAEGVRESPDVDKAPMLSVGVVSCPDDGNTKEDLLSAAQRALAQAGSAKGGGEGHIVAAGSTPTE